MNQTVAPIPVQRPQLDFAELQSCKVEKLPFNHIKTTVDFIRLKLHWDYCSVFSWVKYDVCEFFTAVMKSSSGLSGV